MVIVFIKLAHITFLYLVSAMTTDKNKIPENLKLTTPRRNINKYVSPLSHRKTNFHSSISNGRLSPTRIYKISKLPISSVKHRKLPKDHLIDNVHQDSAKTLEWMNSLVNRAKSVLEKLKEEDLQLQEELYEDSRRKELQKIHVQNILNKTYEDKMEYDSTVSSTVSNTAELSEERDGQDGSSIEQDQLSENEEDDDDALVILTDSEVEVNEPDNIELDEEQADHDEDLFGQSSDYENKVPGGNVSPVQGAEQLLSSDSAESYEQDIEHNEYTDENVDYDIEPTNNEHSEEDEEDDKSHNDTTMESDEGSYVPKYNDDIENMVNDTKKLGEVSSDEENIHDKGYHLNATLMVPGMVRNQNISDSNTHLLSSDLQTLAKQALFGNEILDENHELEIPNTYNVQEDNTQEQSNPLSYESHMIETNDIQYGNVSNEENESEEEIDENSRKSSGEDEHSGEVFNYSVGHSEVQASSEPIAIEVESDSNLDESASSEAYSQGYDISDASEEIENNNNGHQEHNFTLGAQSIADMLATIPHNVANRIIGSDNDVEPAEDINMGIGESEIAEETQVDSLPQYTDKVYDIEHHLIASKNLRTVNHEVTTAQNPSMIKNIATNPEEDTEYKKLVSSIPIEEEIAIEVDKIDSNDESNGERRVLGESNVLQPPVLGDICNTQSSFLHENTSIYFTVDEGNETLIKDKIRNTLTNVLIEENDKYKVEISGSVYASSQDNRSTASQDQRNAYTSPFGSDPFSTNENVDDVKALIKDTLLSISNPVDHLSSQTDSFKPTNIQQSNLDNVGNRKEEISVVREFENSGLQHIQEEHPLNDVFSNAATIGESEIENVIPEEHDHIINQNTALTGENLNRIPANGMLDLLANIAQNEDIGSINIPALSHELIHSQAQEIDEEESRPSFTGETIINDIPSIQQRTGEQHGNLIENDDNAEDDSDIGMVTALQEIEETTNISVHEYNVEQETDTDVQSESRLNSPVFHILGNGHHNHLVQDSHDYPTPVESAASSSNSSEHESVEVNEPVENNETNERIEADDVNVSNHLNDDTSNFHAINNDTNIIQNDQPLTKAEEPVEFEGEQFEREIERSPKISITSKGNYMEFSDHEIENEDDQVLLGKGEWRINDIASAREGEKENFKIDNEINSEENVPYSKNDDNNAEMLDSSDIENPDFESRKSLMQKILIAPVNTFKYIARNVQNITNVTENFVDILNAYPTEHDQSSLADDHHNSNVLSDSENRETDPDILYSSTAQVDNNDSSNNDNEDIPILDDTITVFKDHIFKIDGNNVSDIDNTPQTFLQRTSEQEKDITADNHGEVPEALQNFDDTANHISEYAHRDINDEWNSDVPPESDVDMDVEVGNENHNRSIPALQSQIEGTTNNIEMKENLKLLSLQTTREIQSQPLRFENLVNNESNIIVENNMTPELTVHVEEVNADLESISTAENSPSGNMIQIGIVENQISDDETANENVNDNVGLHDTDEIIRRNIDNTEGSTVHVDNEPDDITSRNETIMETNPVLQDIEVNMQDIASQAVANIITQMATEPEDEPLSSVILSTVATVPSDDSEYYTTEDADKILRAENPQDNHDLNIENYDVILDHKEDVSTNNNVVNEITEELSMVRREEEEEEESRIKPTETDVTNDDSFLIGVSVRGKGNDEEKFNHHSLDNYAEIQNENIEEPLTTTIEVNINNTQNIVKESENVDIENEHSKVKTNGEEDEDNNIVVREKSVENSIERETLDISEQANEESNSDAEINKIIQIGILPKSSNETGDQAGSEVDVKISEGHNLEDIPVISTHNDIHEESTESESKEKSKEILLNETPAQQDVHMLSRELKNDTTDEESKELQSLKKRNKRRTRNLRKRKRAITGDSGSDGPSKRTRRGALQKKNNFDRRTKRNTRK